MSPRSMLNQLILLLVSCLLLMACMTEPATSSDEAPVTEPESQEMSDSEPEEAPVEESETAASAEGQLIITNARLIDGTGAEPVAGMTIVVEGNRIKEITSDAVETAGATVIDAEGRVVMPGLGDLHVHLLLEGGFTSLITNENSIEEYIADQRAERLPERMMQFLELGVTTVIDTGSYWPWILDVRESEQSGELVSPRLFVVGKVFSSANGHPATTICSFTSLQSDLCIEHFTEGSEDPEVLRQVVRDLAASGVDGIKIVVDGSGDKRINPAVAEVVIDETHAQGLPAIGHTMAGIAPTEHVVNAGIDMLVHTVWLENDSYQTPNGADLPTLMAENGVSMIAEPHFTRNNRLLLDSFNAIRNAGVHVYFGTDFAPFGRNANPTDGVRNSLERFEVAGYSALETITIATGNMAAHPMVPDDLGTIEIGNLADIIVLGEGDPLEELELITQPQIVIKDGQILVDKR